MAVRPPVLGDPPQGYLQSFFARLISELRLFAERINAELAIEDDITTNTTVYPVWSTVVKGGTTYKVSSTKLTFNPSTGALGTGGQIAFPATQNPSTDPNTLDDYEEGTWTPVVTASSGTLTSYTATGTYTKVGRLVTASFAITITNAGTGNQAFITGLPFNGAANMGAGTAREIAVAGISGSIYFNSATSLFFVTYNNGNPLVTNYLWVGTIAYNAP